MMKNQNGKEMENEMEPGVIEGYGARQGYR